MLFERFGSPVLFSLFLYQLNNGEWFPLSSRAARIIQVDYISARFSIQAYIPVRISFLKKRTYCDDVIYGTTSSRSTLA